MHNCFVKNTATTDIYTYSHTLSLHEALPISSLASAACPAASESAATERSRLPPPRARQAIRELRARADASRYCGLEAGENRSEEHTSELQSLLRISYAVFCLKNKNLILNPHSPTPDNNDRHSVNTTND